MNLSIVGISHRTAPVEIRERFCLSDVEQELLFERMRSHKCISGVLILSTCNRVEIYFDSAIGIDTDQILHFLFSIKSQDMTHNLTKYFYRYEGHKALCHIFDVVSGLDSLILGEQQILGQVKNAFKTAFRLGMLNSAFHLLNKILINFAKMIRSQTEIGLGGISVSWGAVCLAEKYFTTLKGKSVLLMGSGNMAELAAKNLFKKMLSRLFIMNRTKEKAIALAERFNGESRSFLDLKEILIQVDFCICAVGAPHYIIDKEVIESIERFQKNKLLLIDISVPRNIDPKIRKFQNIELFTMDELGNLLEGNLEKRQNAVRNVRAIAREKILEFDTKRRKMENYRIENSLKVLSRER